MSWAVYLLVFMLGAAVGSFLNVLIERSIKGEGWVKGRSRCDHCGRTLPWYEMVPLVSFLLLRGRASCCKAKLSRQHVLVESMTGLLFVWWMALSSAFFLLVTEPGRTLQPLFWLVTGVLLVLIAVTDWYYGVIPTIYVAAGVVLVGLYRLALIASGSYQAVDLWRSGLVAAGLALFYYFLRVLTRGKGMGEGDVLLAVYLGLLLSYPRVVYATMFAFVSGAVVGVGLMVLKKKTRKDTIAFGPFMILGALAALILKI